MMKNFNNFIIYVRKIGTNKFCQVFILEEKNWYFGYIQKSKICILFQYYYYYSSDIIFNLNIFCGTKDMRQKDLLNRFTFYFYRFLNVITILNKLIEYYLIQIKYLQTIAF